MDKGKYYALAGEEIIVQDILKVIGETDRYCVEFGADDGYRDSNTRYFLNNGWGGIQIDVGNRDNPEIKAEFITVENIELLFEKYGVPKNLDLLSIDIDGNDYWVWKAIENWKPRIVIIEYNPRFPVGEKKAIEYEPEYNGKGTLNYSASFSALKELGEKKGYRLVKENDKNNLFFVLESELPEGFEFPLVDVSFLPFNGTKFVENNHPFVEV